MSKDNPGVTFPPPFLYAGAVLGGVLLDRLVPLRIAAGGWRELAALALAVAWAALTATSIGRFWLAGTTVLPMRAASRFVVSGPYRFTRNPMYLGMTLLTVAFALFFNTWWPVLFLAPVTVVVQRFVIAREEAYLRRRFGADYDAYTTRVRRWL